MQTSIHLTGNVYEIVLKSSGPIKIASGAHSFSVLAMVKNIGDVIWDTSDLLRVVVMLIEPGERGKVIPRYVALRSVDFPNRHIHPGDETELDINLSVNQIPDGEYVLVFDLAVEMKYFLVTTGGRRAEFPIQILPRGAVETVLYPRVSRPGGAPRRAWRPDPEIHSANHAFHVHHVGETDLHANGRTAIRFESDYMSFRHYAHFIEFIVCLYAIYREYIGNDTEIIILIGQQEFSYANNPDVQ